MFKVLDALKPLTEEWGSDRSLQHAQPQPGSERGSAQQDRLLAAAKELQQAWGRSLHCQLQLQTRLEILQDWAMALQQDGGTLGEEMPERERMSGFEQSAVGTGKLLSLLSHSEVLCLKVI